MKSDGNHGGGTDTERNTALMFFSHNKGFMLPTQTIPWHSQTSLAPTLALFLNVSVPANTLAEPLYEILPDEFLPYRSEIESNARNIIRKSLIKRGVVFSPGNEVQAAK
jgi:hypothetical protein